VSVSEALDRWRAGDRAEVLSSQLLQVLASVPDPRAARGRRYSLVALLAVAILAVAAGMRGYAGFATWARTAPEEVLSQLGIRFRCPSEKTFRRVLSSLDAADLDRRLGAYFTLLAATAPDPGGLVTVSLDGKTLKGARRKAASASHLVSMFAHRTRLVLGQLAVAEKSNEIPCVRALLKSFPKVRLMVVIDAALPPVDWRADSRPGPTRGVHRGFPGRCTRMWGCSMDLWWGRRTAPRGRRAMASR
jgi:hypothetical protein